MSSSSGNLWGEQGMYDSALLAMMKNCGKIQPFLECIFSFLSRRTDFYIIMEHDKAEMGFRPGVAMNMVVQAFKKYEILTRKREAELLREVETKRIDLMTDDLSEQPQVDIESSTNQHLSKLAKLQMEPESDTPTEDAMITGPPPVTKKEEVPVAKTIHTTNPKTLTKPVVNPPTTKKPKESEALKLSSDAFNGSKMDNYVWCQTISDLDIRVSIPAGTTGKDVKVDIKNDFLRVEVIRPEKDILLQGRLTNRIKVEESMWTVDKDSKDIHINLEKTKETMWKSVFEGEKGIDLTKVDTTRNIGDFDQEAQAAIERVTYDHHMKMLGKPTSSEQKAHDILRKAWDAPGSPFKGTPFDPSRVNVTGVW